MLLTFKSDDPSLSHAFEGRCETKHPAKTKTGIVVSWKNFDGSEAGKVGGCPITGKERCAYRIVAEFPPAIALPRKHYRRVEDVPVLAEGGVRA